MSALGSIPQEQRVSAVLINYEAGPTLLECLESLVSQDVGEIIVVDNGSSDGSAAAAARAFPQVELVTPERNLGFAGGANLGAGVASGELLLFLNPDVRLGPGAIRALADEFAASDVGVAGPPLHVQATGSVEHGATVDVIGSPVPLDRGARPLYVPGCALMTRSELFGELGGFDARFFLFVEDVDYCWRVLLRGFDVRIPDIEPVWHQGGSVTPGGYAGDGRLVSTTFRVALRERNTLTTLIKCYGAPLACILVPVYAVQSMATAGVLAAWGNRRTARAVVSSLGWNVRQLRTTLRMRRQVQRSRVVGDAAVVGRMYRGVWKLHLLRRFGVPSVVEWPSAPKRLQQSSGGSA